VKRVAILSVSVGAGHMRAAQALQTVADTVPGEFRSWDVLELMPPHFQGLYRDTYLDVVSRVPDVFGWLYDVTDRPFQGDPIRQLFEEAHAARFFQTLDEWAPDAVICTHFLPATLLYARRRKGRFPARIYTVVTDFDIHGMWLATPADHIFVAGEESRCYLERLGVQSEHISVTGIPTDPVFSQPRERAEMAQKHGLRPDLPTILMSTGGFGTSPAVELLEELTRVQTPVQVIACCGRNEKLLADVSAFARARHAKLHVKPQGFTREIDELMSCCDLILGKPGGLTTWESFAKGLAWVVVDPIPGQEQRNTYHLLEEGVGVWAYERRTLSYKVERLLGNPQRLEAMRENSRRQARPHAARDIIEWVAHSGN
jgi:processive 1,2-diacylglycerol beta-glucosyltransferase